jgi:malonyl-CoA/methylmalonyl-CoA synthetase
VSGDLGFADARGYIYISGREKDLIISGGLNVYPAEVESIIEALPGVAECAVIGVGHPDFGEGVVAVIVPRPGATPTEDSLKQALSEQLANYKLPKRVFVAAELPRNAMGKIQKVELRRRYADIFGADRENGDRPA